MTIHAITSDLPSACSRAASKPSKSRLAQPCKNEKSLKISIPSQMPPAIKIWSQNALIAFRNAFWNTIFFKNGAKHSPTVKQMDVRTLQRFFVNFHLQLNITLQLRPYILVPRELMKFNILQFIQICHPPAHVLRQSRQSPASPNHGKMRKM